VAILHRPGPESLPRHIFVTGGVASSLGKGLTAASLGQLLRARGLRVTMQKLDPYINVDPGRMNPFQHGEVFVTEDGAETDLDIGHYERFLDVNLTGEANATTGQVYSTVIAKERRGEYGGDTVQVIPHITDEIKARMRAQARPADGSAPDVIITEIGGTVGDIESQPFLEAARQVRQDLGRDNVFFVHVSLVPYLTTSSELKTKPTQHSVSMLRSIGIQPDAIVCRTDRELPEGVKRKIALMCDVENEAVVECMDAESIYEIPAVLHREGLDAYVVRRLNVPFRDVNWRQWDDLLHRVRHPRENIEVAIVGKYVDLPDAYLSLPEALRAGGFHHYARVTLRWVAADDCATPEHARNALVGVDALVVPGGFGVGGIGGKLNVLQRARETGLPTLGICLGMQCMVIEYARNVMGLTGASSTEFEDAPSDPVVITWAEEAGPDAGIAPDAMRLGAYEAHLKPGSLAAATYGTTEISERHRHGYEINFAYRSRLEEAGLIVSGESAEGRLIEMIELAPEAHPYYIATQAHPEFKSRPTRAHPLFTGLVSAALERQRATRLLEVDALPLAPEAATASHDTE